MIFIFIMFKFYTDTYDVQSVSGTAIPGGLKLNCTFAEGSRAQSCIITLCRIENGMEVFCMNVTISREDSAQTFVINLQPGLYSVKEVAEVESDDQVTVIERKFLQLEYLITESLQTTSMPG